jgi:hypothetical protein
MFDMNADSNVAGRARWIAVLFGAAYLIVFASGTLAADDVVVSDSILAESPARVADGPALIVFADQQAEPEDCKTFEVVPLQELTVDTQPIDQPGPVELSSARPTDCASYVCGNAPALFVGGQSCCAGPDLWPVWPAAQFCHRPLYFEETGVERYGCKRCCQPASSACHFFGAAILLPVQMCLVPPTRCVSTPPY